MKRYLIMLIAICMALTTLSLNIYAVPAEGSVNIVMDFDKTEYLPGEMAALTISLTGIEEEVASGIKLGSFETHIGFDAEELTYVAAESGFESALGLGLGDVAEIASSADTVSLMMNKQSGVALSGTKLDIATLKFNVSESLSEDYEFSVYFEDKSINSGTSNLVSVVIPVGGAQAAEKMEYTIPQTVEKATVLGAVLTASAPTYDGGTDKVTAPITISKSADGKSPVLIVAIYGKNSDLLAAPVYINTSIDGNSSTVSLTGDNAPKFENIPAGEYEIKYYLWENFSTMKSVAEVKSNLLSAM